MVSRQVVARAQKNLQRASNTAISQKHPNFAAESGVNASRQ
jgi:hypothetical protein